MSVTTTIREDWNDLSLSAQRHILGTRPHLLRTWHLIEEGYHFDTVEADSLDEACELAAMTRRIAALLGYARQVLQRHQRAQERR